MQAVREFINNNKGIFIIAVSVFAAGIIIGTAVACGLGAAETTQLREQLSRYISYGAASSVSFSRLLTSRCADNLRYMLVVLLCARSVHLLPLAAVCLGIKGYQLGFAVSFVCGSFGSGGIAITAATSLFSYALVIPLYMLAFALAAVYAQRRKSARNSQKGELAAVCAVMAALYGVLCIAAVAEAFVIPLFAAFFN